MRRTVFLAAAAGLALALTALVRAPAPHPDALHGPRLVRAAPGAVRGITVGLDGRRVVLRRAAAGWEVDGRAAGPGAVDAVHDLLETLARLRALDAFRADDLAAFGLAPARGTLVIETVRGRETVDIGGLNTAGSRFYARRAGESRVLQIGTGLLSALERVFYEAGRPGPPPETG